MISILDFTRWMSEDETIHQDVRKLITNKIAEYIELNTVEAKFPKAKQRLPKPESNETPTYFAS